MLKNILLFILLSVSLQAQTFEFGSSKVMQGGNNPIVHINGFDSRIKSLSDVIIASYIVFFVLFLSFILIVLLVDLYGG